MILNFQVHQQWQDQGSLTFDSLSTSKMMFWPNFWEFLASFWAGSCCFGLTLLFAVQEGRVWTLHFSEKKQLWYYFKSRRCFVEPELLYSAGYLHALALERARSLTPTKILSFISKRQRQEKGMQYALWKRSGSNPEPWGYLTPTHSLPPSLSLLTLNSLTHSTRSTHSTHSLH